MYSFKGYTISKILNKIRTKKTFASNPSFIITVVKERVISHFHQLIGCVMKIQGQQICKNK